MNLFLKPALDSAGKPVLVRDPTTMKPLESGGEWKTNSPYWIRRMRDKDVIDATAAEQAKAVAPAAVAPAAPPVEVASISPASPAAEPAESTSLLNLINPPG